MRIRHALVHALATVAALGLGTLLPLAVLAQAYPNRPIQLIVPYPPGGSTEALARLVQAKLAASLGQAVVIDHRGGNAGNIGSAFAAKSPPDGYRFLLSTNAVITVNPHVYKDIGFDALNDLVPITNGVKGIIGIGVHSSLGVNTIRELVEYAKRNPRSLFYGTAGAGSPQHVAGEALNEVAGIDLSHVPYKGAGPVITDLVGGHIKLGIATLSALLPHADNGPVSTIPTIRILAIGERMRFDGAPNIPTIAETYPGFEATSWLGFFAPAGTPREIVARLNTELVAAMNAEDVKAKLRALALVVIGDSSEAFGETVRSEYERWGKVIRAKGIRAE